jgi:uncharacterized protein YjbI with pentapeptide repeats
MIDLAETLRLHKMWLEGIESGTRADLTDADLTRANLRGADLRGADLTGANLTGANLTRVRLDYSCWPLWCGSVGVKVDARIAAQLAAHFCAVDCDGPAYLAAREAVLSFAKTSHRAVDIFGDTEDD